MTCYMKYDYNCCTFHQTQSNSTDPEQTTHSDVQGQFIKIYLEIVLISNNH